MRNNSLAFTQSKSVGMFQAHMTTTFTYLLATCALFLPWDASAERGDATVSRLSVRP